jgi:hypothetical protein
MILIASNGNGQCHILSLRVYVILFILILVVFLSVFQLIQKHYVAFALSSSSFIRQEIKDTPLDWIDMSTGKETKGPSNTDIQSVTYSSDGQLLNATLWMSSFDKSPVSNRVMYGLLIDADFNGETGYQGMDYKSEVAWNKTSGSWTRVFDELSSNGRERELEVNHNYTKFYSQRDGYITLYLNLTKTLSPLHYRVFFYAYSQVGQSLIMDAVRWAYIPPPEFAISTSPKVIDVFAEDKAPVEVRLNSSTGFNPLVHFSANNLPKDIKLDFIYPDRQVPSYGMGVTPLTISAARDATVGPHTIFVSGKLAFPTQYFESPIKKVGQNKALINIASENVSTQTAFIVNIHPHSSLPEQIKQWLNDWFNPLTGTWTTVATVASGVLGWKIWRRNKNPDTENSIKNKTNKRQ